MNGYYQNVFVELGYMARYFPSLQYDALPAAGFPDDLSERMYAGGFVLRVGASLGVKSKPAKKRTLVCGKNTTEVVEVKGHDVDYRCVGGQLSVSAPYAVP